MPFKPLPLTEGGTEDGFKPLKLEDTGTFKPLPIKSPAELPEQEAPYMA